MQASSCLLYKTPRSTKMKYFQSQATIILWIAAIFVTSPAAEEPQSVFVLSPEPKSYSMHIREFHECVSCHENNQIRNDYNKCLHLLSEQNRKIIKSCCESTFDKAFCKRDSIEKEQFARICTNPQNALEVGRCFWKKTPNKNSSDIETYRTCKKTILSRYCTSSS